MNERSILETRFKEMFPGLVEQVVERGPAGESRRCEWKYVWSAFGVLRDRIQQWLGAGNRDEIRKAFEFCEYCLWFPDDDARQASFCSFLEHVLWDAKPAHYGLIAEFITPKLVVELLEEGHVVPNAFLRMTRPWGKVLLAPRPSLRDIVGESLPEDQGNTGD